jgi:formylmethanofuran dehydrogenase subunit E
MAVARPAGAVDPNDEAMRAAQRVHGGFGSLVAVGLRIGETALRDLDASPREVDVTFFDGVDTPCACIVDGVMVATSASPGQRTLRVTAESAPPGWFAIVEVRHRTRGALMRYGVPETARARLLGWNRIGSAEARRDAVQSAPEHQVFVRLP